MDLETISFKIISQVGLARSIYVEAIQQAKAGNFDRADELIIEGYEAFREGHLAHAGLIQTVAQGIEVKLDLILMHAEDQMMSTDSFKLIAEEFIAMYKFMHNK